MNYLAVYTLGLYEECSTAEVHFYLLLCLFLGLKASLERLQLDYVDVVFANRPDPNTPMEGNSSLVSTVSLSAFELSPSHTLNHVFLMFCHIAHTKMHLFSVSMTTAT